MSTVSSNIRDNCKREKAARVLSEDFCPDAVLSVASAYFTVQAYDQFREKLDAIASMRFLFGAPDYVNKIDPEKTASKRFAIVNNGLDLKDALRQKAAVKGCAEWIRAKVEIKSVINRALLHGKLCHIAWSERQPPLVALVDRILAAKRANPAADIAALERDLDGMVSALYGLSAHETAIVEGK